MTTQDEPAYDARAPFDSPSASGPGAIAALVAVPLLAALAGGTPAAVSAQQVPDSVAVRAESEVLGRALRDSAGARQAEAPRYAPRLWAEAGELLDRARRRLSRALAASGDGSPLVRARAAAGPAADSAALAYRAAWRMAFRADSVRRRPATLESILLERDSVVSATARAAGVTPTPLDGPADDLEAVRRVLASRADSVAALRGRLERTEAARRETSGRADSLAAVLDSVGERLAEASAELERRRRRESRVREVKALFSGEEGSVLATEDSVVVRLSGLTFPPGEAELPEDADALLVKLRSAIQAFPGARVRVEGHTDAEGDAEQNRVLSLRRAIAVREDLLLHLPIGADRIQAVGRGESEPVASNDTEEGRAQNRRIEVILEL